MWVSGGRHVSWVRLGGFSHRLDEGCRGKRGARGNRQVCGTAAGGKEV